MAQRLKPNLYNTLIECLSRVFDNTPGFTKPYVIAKLALIDVNKIGMDGSAYDIWDRILSRAQEEDKITSIVEIAKQRSQHELLGKLLVIINNGAAFVEEERLAAVNVNVGVTIKKRLKVFLNYNKTDVAYKDNLVDYLRLLGDEMMAKDQLHFDIFDMHTVTAGENKKEVIEKELELSDIVLLFLSIHFLNRDGGYCYAPLTIKAFEMGKKIVPIYVRQGSYERIKLIGGIVPLPQDEEPLANKEGNGEVMDGVYESMALCIGEIIKKLS